MSGNFMPIEGEEASLREWFHRLANARENPETLAGAKEWLLRLLADTPAGSALGCHPGQTGTAMDETAEIPGSTDFPKPEPGNNADLIAFHAPLALLEGAWLQSVAVAANGHREPVNKLFACYLTLLGKDESDSPAFAYRGWLNNCQIGLPEASAWCFAHNLRVGASALHFASLQLVLGLHSSCFFPETLGFTLAYAKSVSPWRLPALPKPRRDAILATMAGQCESALQAFAVDSEEWPRLCRGFALYNNHEARYLSDLQAFADRSVSLVEGVALIFRRKLRFARGYHAGVELGGRALEEWFAGSPFDASGFLDAFASSIYVKGEKGHRPFDRMTRFGGPMFGVFDRDELDLINAWLDEADDWHKAAVAGATVTDGLHPAHHHFPAGAGMLDFPHPAGRKKPGNAGCNGMANFRLNRFLTLPMFGRIDNRGLFNLLINEDTQTSTLSMAQRRVEQVLSRAFLDRHRIGPLNQRLFDYSPADFAERIVQIHEEEIAKYKPLQAPPTLRREEFIWGIRQFAPAILVDGCWLQHMGEAVHQGQRLQRLLHRIYAEELGGGIVEWNHPKIYRDLLNELAIELPSTETMDFAYHPDFLDASFDLPGYLLAISQFPGTYLPEILGLNLAIELSGLGGGYMRLAEELRYWKINPLIVTLHLSIDNLAGGHAAMACEAIQLYMDGVLSLGGTAMAEKNWSRIWNGYLSLNRVSRRFKMALILGFCSRIIPRRLFSLISLPKSNYNSM